MNYFKNKPAGILKIINSGISFILLVLLIIFSVPNKILICTLSINLLFTITYFVFGCILHFNNFKESTNYIWNKLEKCSLLTYYFSIAFILFIGLINSNLSWAFLITAIIVSILNILLISITRNTDNLLNYISPIIINILMLILISLKHSFFNNNFAFILLIIYICITIILLIIKSIFNNKEKNSYKVVEIISSSINILLSILLYLSIILII